MRIISLSLMLAFTGLAACAPAYEDGHQSREINKQRAARDACLSTEAVTLDDRSSTPDAIGRQAAAACTAQNDKLIQAMSTMDRSGAEQISIATRKDSIIKATSYVLKARGGA
jgi:hypothetical protein